MATKWVAQMPKPPTTPEQPIQIALVRPAAMRARASMLMAAAQAPMQSRAAKPTRSKSC
jgi:hypothetical protein